MIGGPVSSVHGTLLPRYSNDEREEAKRMKKVTHAEGECANCAAPQGTHSAVLKLCSKCKLAAYCSRNCQLQHWRDGGHKRFCLAPPERAQPPVVEEFVRKDTSQECIICRDELITSSASRLSCGHTFHKFCLANLRKFGVSQASCPLCRGPLSTEVKNKNPGAFIANRELTVLFLFLCSSFFGFACSKPA